MNTPAAEHRDADSPFCLDGPPQVDAGQRNEEKKVNGCISEQAPDPVPIQLPRIATLCGPGIL